MMVNKDIVFKPNDKFFNAIANGHYSGLGLRKISDVLKDKESKENGKIVGSEVQTSDV